MYYIHIGDSPELPNNFLKCRCQQVWEHFLIAQEGVSPKTYKTFSYLSI